MSSSQIPTKVPPAHDVARESGASFADLAGWKMPQVFTTVEQEVTIARRGVALADSSASGKIVVEGKQAEGVLQAAWAMPSLAIGQGVILGSRSAYLLRDDQFFVHLEPGGEGSAAKVLSEEVERRGDLVTVSDITHGRSDLLLIGPKSAGLLSRLCSLDFHPSQFPDLSARVSSVAKTRQLILRNDFKPPDGPTVPVFSLIGDRSLAIYLWQTILEAGRDLDVAPVGWSALAALRAGT